MTPRQQRTHLRIWLVLLPLLLAALVVGAAVRPAPPVDTGAGATP